MKPVLVLNSRSTSTLLVSPQLDSLYFTSKLELDDTPVPLIIPDDDLVWWILWIFSSSDKREIIAAKKHLHNANSAVFKLYIRELM